MHNEQIPAKRSGQLLCDSALCPHSSKYIQFQPASSSSHEAKMTAQTPPAGKTLQLQSRAAAAIATLQTSLLCASCNRAYGRGRPYRSKWCAHTVCSGCAAVARGRLGRLANASPAVRAAGGTCPVPECQTPVRPADLAEDVSIAAVVRAGAELADWMAKETGASQGVYGTQ